MSDINWIERVVQHSTILGFDVSINQFTLIIPTSTGLMPLLKGNLEMVVHCKEKYEDSLRIALKHYGKVMESLEVIRDCSTDPVAAAEAKDRIGEAL